MSPITAGLSHDQHGLPTWVLLDGTTFTRDALDVLSIARPGREVIRGRLGHGETHRAAYDRLLELDGLQRAAAVLYDDYSAAVTCVRACRHHPVARVGRRHRGGARAPRAGRRHPRRRAPRGHLA